MELTTFFLSELDREVERSRRALQNVPAGKYDWKPHDKSMIFGYLTDMVATIPTWITMNQSGRTRHRAQGRSQHAARSDEHERGVSRGARQVGGGRPRGAGEDDRRTPADDVEAAGGRNVVQEQPRYEMIQDTINHWAHHRGQMTVYLRLMGAKVPALYGPSADDKRF